MFSKNIDTKFLMEAEDDLIKIKAFVTAQIDLVELERLLEDAVKERISDN